MSNQSSTDNPSGPRRVSFDPQSTPTSISGSRRLDLSGIPESDETGQEVPAAAQVPSTPNRIQRFIDSAVRTPIQGIRARLQELLSPSNSTSVDASTAVDESELGQAGVDLTQQAE